MSSPIRHVSFNERHNRANRITETPPPRAPIPRKNPKKGPSKFPWKKILFALVSFGILFIGGIFMYFLHGIPSIDRLEKDEYFKESTIIYDKNGNQIYSLFKDGKRTYVAYDEISQSIKDAIVATEDKTFFTNPGIDFLGLVRVGASYVTGGKFGRIGGASTISQQLIKNTLLTNEVSVRRKAQEAVLSYQMNRRYSKEKILEMYLNAFSFGYNANGVEQASQTYFGKSAKDVGPFGASILAALPQAPTKYSPYDHRDRLMGKLEVYPSDDSMNRKELTNATDRQEYKDLYTSFKSYLSGMIMERTDSGLNVCGLKKENTADKNFSPNGDGCIDIPFSKINDFVGSIIITKPTTLSGITDEYTIEYTVGRKDLVAGFMLEDNKIDGETFKKIIYDGLEFEFKKYTENIKYPYFVMYVKEYLENKYGKDMDITSGLKVYTTIDPELQEKAEEIVKKQAAINTKSYGASSAALISMDNTDGKLLAMVGGPDYFDEKNGGNNNMATANRQPGSSFKPFVYAIAIAKNPIGPETPVADVDTKFGSWHPDNYDGKFLGVMMVKNALDYSRNIPAGKMYFLAGQQDAIVKQVRAMGITTLKEEKEHSYGGPLAIGAGEVKPIEIMQAYSVFANNGVKKELYAIEKITTSDGTPIEEHRKTEGKEVFSPAAAYIVNKILSDNDARPESTYWRNAISIAGHKVAAKTGTANKPGKNHKAILPGDLWTIGYTPQITTIVWAGNVDGTAMSPKAESLNSAAPIWKSYMEYALKNLPNTDWKKPDNLYTYDIVKTSGLLASKNTPSNQIVSTIMAVKLDEYDNGGKEIKVDTLCNGTVTDATPPDAVKTIYIPSSKPVIDGYDPEWMSGFFASIKKYQVGSGGLIGGSDPCTTRPTEMGLVSFSVVRTNDTTVAVNFTSDRMIASMHITGEGIEDKTFSYADNARKSGSENISIPSGKNPVFTLDVIDVYGYRYTQTISIGGSSNAGNNSGSISNGATPIDTSKDGKTPPVITVINPKGNTLNLYEGQPFNLRFRANIATAAREVQIFVDGTVQKTMTSGDVFVVPMSSEGLTLGKHTVRITAIDGNFQSTEASFTLNIMPQ